MQLDLALEACRHIRVVRGDHQREAELTLQCLDQREHARARVGVEVPRGLVAKQEPRLLRHGTCDRNALRLAARQLGRQIVRLLGETDELEQGERLEALLPLGVIRGLDREGDVLEGGEVRKEVRALEDVGEAARTCLGARRRVQRGEWPALPVDHPCRGLDEPAEYV